MKRMLITFVLSVLMAGASHAYVQVGHLAQPKADGQPTMVTELQTGVREMDDDHGDNATAPVPEPGTIALASMGLAALGAAHRRRKQK